MTFFALRRLPFTLLLFFFLLLAVLEAAFGVNINPHGIAEGIFELAGRECIDCRQGEGAADDDGVVQVVGRIEGNLAAACADDDNPDAAVSLGQEGYDVFLALLGRPAGDLGAADADGRDRRGDDHGVGAAGRDLAGDEDEDTLNNRDAHGTDAGLGIVDQIVDHHAPPGAQGECGVVDKHQTDRGIQPGLHDIAEINRRIHLEGYLGAVGPRCRHRSIDDAGNSDGLGVGGCSGLGVLARRQRSGEAGHQLGRQHRAAGGGQRRGIGKFEISPNENLFAVRADQQ